MLKQTNNTLLLIKLFALLILLVFTACGGGGGGGGGTEPVTSSGTSTPTPTPTPTPTLTAPTIQVPTGKKLVSGSKVGITNSVTGATVYYTLDGTNPTSSSSVYTSSKVTINSACTLKTVAIKDGVSSDVTSATYSIAPIKNAPDSVNDIVFKDGTAIAYSADLSLTSEFQSKFKTDAIAMIFYKGTDCNDSGSTARTLGVSLKSCLNHNQKWCTSNANAYGDMKDINTIHENVKDGSQHLSKIGTWLASYFTNDTATESKYPAFYWAKNYGSSNGTIVTDWYLPSKTELQKVYAYKATLDAAIQLCDFDNCSSYYFSRGTFWSSSQYTSDGFSAHLLSFSNGQWSKGSKSNPYDVCAVRAF